MKQPIPSNDIRNDEALYIRELQQALRIIDRGHQGYSDVPVDGTFGDNTTTAVQRTQQSAGLDDTGTVDYDTWEAIVLAARDILQNNTRPVSVYAFRQGQSPLHTGDTGDVVRILQIMLNTLCRHYVNLTACDTDGVFGTNTAAAVEQLQRIAGLSPTGIVDKDTWDAITELYNLN